MTEKPTIEQLINDVKNHQDWRVRQQSIQQLGEYDTAEAMEVIATALYDDSPHVVQTAALTLAQFGSDAVPLLLEALNSEKDIASPAFILHALGRIGDPSAIPAVIEILETEDKGLHGAALQVVAKIPDKRTFDTIIKLLEKTSEHMKHLIAQALGALGAGDAIPHLKPLLYSSEQVTRRHAAIAFGRIDDNTALDTLLEASRSERGDVRYNVAEGLGMKNDERAFNRLVELLRDEYGMVRGMAAKAIAEFDGIRAAPYIIKMIDDPDSAVQSFLISALGSIQYLEIIPVLMQRYRNAPSYNRGESLYYFVEKWWNYSDRGESAVYDALEALQSPDENLRIAAVWLLYQANSDRWRDTDKWIKAGNKIEDFQESPLQGQVIEALIDALNDDSADVRLSAIEALARSIDKRATKSLIRLLDDDDLLVVQEAADKLGLVRDSSAVQHLLNLTKSSHKKVQYSAIYALGGIGDEAAFGGLKRFISHPDKWIRIRTIRSLGSLRGKKAIPVLLKMLKKEKNDEVREALVMSLQYHFRDKWVQKELIQVLRNPRTSDKWYHYKIRDSVMYVLGTIPNEELLPVFYEEINTASEWQLRMSATKAVAWVGTERESADRMFELLGHEHETVRTTASEQLGYLGARTDDLELRDYIVGNLIQRLQDVGAGYHASPTVAHMAAKSLYYVGTQEANEALRKWGLKRDDDSEADD